MTQPCKDFVYIIAIFCLSIFTFCASNSYALDFQSSRTLSLGKGGRGGALLNDTITLNPSLLGFQPIASLSATMNWIGNNDPGAAKAPNVDNSSDHRIFNVSVIDGKNEYVNAGISFTRRPDLDFFHIALAKRATQWLSFGTSVKRFSSRSNTLSASGGALSGFDAGVSTSVILPEGRWVPAPMQIGLTADNLAHNKNDEPYLGPRQAGAGVKINIREILLVYTDVVENFSHFSGAFPTYSGGSELALGNNVFVRGGVFGYREKGWSAGGGWVGPKLGINYGYQRKTFPGDKAQQHAVTMDVYM